MHQLVEHRVEHHAQLHLQLLQADRYPTEAVPRHQFLGVHRPALDERAGEAERAGPGAAPVPARVGELEVVARHRLVHRQVADHVVVVLAVERLDPLRRPVGRGRRDGVERRYVGGLQRAGRAAVCHRDTPGELRHLLHHTGIVHKGHQAVPGDEPGRLAQRHPGKLHNGRVVGMVVAEPVQRRLDGTVVSRPAEELRSLSIIQ